MEPILFNWKGKEYRVGRSAYNKNQILLPDGTLLTVLSWYETNPPRPKELWQCTLTIPLLADLTTFANRFNAELAEEITS